MKILVYNILQTEDENGVVLSEKMMQWSEANEEIVKKEAYEGKYTIEDDGQPDPIETPTEFDKLDARLTYVEMMTGIMEV